MPATPRPPAFITKPPRKVVFLDVHNSARSQMAEAMAHAFAPAEAEVWSAGTEPSSIHPVAVEVMHEIGIDLGRHHSKSLANVPWREADTIVTLCGEAELACPPTAAEVRRVYWPLPDPTQASPDRALDVFRDVRDGIRWRISSLWPAGD